MAVLITKHKKERDTQTKFDECITRERAARQRIVDLHSTELHTIELQAERKSDKAWQRICNSQQRQLGELQEQVAEFEL